MSSKQRLNIRSAANLLTKVRLQGFSCNFFWFFLTWKHNERLNQDRDSHRNKNHYQAHEEIWSSETIRSTFLVILIWSMFALGKSLPCLDSQHEIPMEEEPIALRHVRSHYCSRWGTSWYTVDSSFIRILLLYQWINKAGEKMDGRWRC